MKSMEFLPHSEKKSKAGIPKSNEVNGTNRGLFEARIFGECFSFTNYIVFIFFLGSQNNETFGGTTVFIDVNGAVALC